MRSALGRLERIELLIGVGGPKIDDEELGRLWLECLRDFLNDGTVEQIEAKMRERVGDERTVERQMGFFRDLDAKCGRDLWREL